MSAASWTDAYASGTLPCATRPSPGKARAALLRVDGVRDIELNPLSGSALILYDSARLSQDRLIETGCRWADWLDKAARGQAGEMPPL